MQAFKHMLAFREVAKVGSFSEAARKLRVTAASVSRSVAMLEAHVGVQLMHRTTRHLQLTPEGHNYLALIEPAIHSLLEADSRIRDQSDKVEGSLKVSLPFQLAKTLVIPQLPTFFDRYPDLSIQVSLEDSVYDLVERSLDLALHFGAPSNPNYIAKRLYTAPVYMSASPKYIERYGAPRSPEELNVGHIIGGTAVFSKKRLLLTCTTPQRAHKTFEIGLQNPLRLELINFHESHFSVAYAGLGIIFLDLFMARRDLEEGKLKIILPDYCLVPNFPSEYDLYITYPEREYIPKRVQVFKDFLVELVQSATQETVDPYRYR